MDFLINMSSFVSSEAAELKTYEALLYPRYLTRKITIGFININTGSGNKSSATISNLIYGSSRE